MLLSQIAVKRLEAMTGAEVSKMTHDQKNAMVEKFLEEKGRLLDQKAESTLKEAVECYRKGEMSREEYMSIVEGVSGEEAVRGAAYGGQYALNRVFDFAQKELDRAKERADIQTVAEAKKQYETDVKRITQEQKAILLHDQKLLIERAKEEVEQHVSKLYQEKGDWLEKEVQEQKKLHPAREAASRAIAQLLLSEKKLQRQKRVKAGLMGFGIMTSLIFAAYAFFYPPSREAIILFLVMIALIIFTLLIWKERISEEKIAAGKREIAHFQTNGGEYVLLSEDARCALLVQKIM